MTAGSLIVLFQSFFASARTRLGFNPTRPPDRSTGDPDEDVFERLRLVPGVELGRCSKRQQLAVVDYPDPITELLRLLHIVGRQQDCLAPALQFPDVVPNCVAGLRVHGHRGFVEEEELRVLYERHRDAHPPLHPPTVPADSSPCIISQSHLTYHIVDLRLQRSAPKGVEFTEKRYVLSPRQEWIDRSLLRGEP